MAVHDHDSKEQTQQSSMASAFETQTNKQHQPAPAPAGGGFSFRNMGNLGRHAMGRTPASEVLSKLTKALEAVVTEAVDKTFEVTLLPVDMMSTSTLGVSILIVVLRDLNRLDLGAAYHTLIVEASVEPPAPRLEVINGLNTEIIRTIDEAYDSVMQAEAKRIVTNAFSQSRLLAVQAEVVPRDFNINDTQAVYALAANALFACSSELEINNPEFEDLNLANAERDSLLSVRTTFGNPQVNNAVGQPIRSDVVIDFSAAPANQNNQQSQVADRTSSIARISGFMDLVWNPEQVQQSYYNSPTNFRKYSVRFVTTMLESTQLLTIPAQLLALVPALTLRENDLWVNAFRRQSFAGGFDMHDIGGINIEANLEGDAYGVGTRIDTKADSFKPEHLHKLIASTINPGMVISLDVPECGPETWYNDVFAAAADNDNYQLANQALINAANHLTDGKFSKYFPINGRVALDEFNRIQLGHYTDKDGVQKDIRNIDYLAVTNIIGEKDPQIIRDWSDTFLRTNYPIPLRLAARKRIISGMFSDFTITGYARRVTFTAEFINALERAVADTGLTIRPISTYADAGSYDRATANFSGSALLSTNSAGIFSRGSFGQNQTGFGNTRGFVQRAGWSI